MTIHQIGASPGVTDAANMCVVRAHLLHYAPLAALKSLFWAAWVSSFLFWQWTLKNPKILIVIIDIGFIKRFEKIK